MARIPPGAEDILSDLWPGDVQGIEVYRRSIGAPAGCGSPLRDCGTILVWTEPTPPRKKAARRPKSPS